MPRAGDHRASRFRTHGTLLTLSHLFVLLAQPEPRQPSQLSRRRRRPAMVSHPARETADQTLTASDGLESLLHRYKDFGPDHRWLAAPLAALTRGLLVRHLRCLETRFGPFDFQTHVPSWGRPPLRPAPDRRQPHQRLARAMDLQPDVEDQGRSVRRVVSWIPPIFGLTPPPGCRGWRSCLSTTPGLRGPPW